MNAQVSCLDDIAHTSSQSVHSLFTVLREQFQLQRKLILKFFTHRMENSKNISKKNL